MFWFYWYIEGLDLISANNRKILIITYQNIGVLMNYIMYKLLSRWLANNTTIDVMLHLTVLLDRIVNDVTLGRCKYVDTSQ